MRTCLSCLSLSLSLVVPALFGGPSIVYWTDTTLGDDAMAGALDGLATSSEFGAITTAVDDSDFVQKIGSGDYDLGILFVQGSTEDYASIGALADFAAAGGQAMYADWTAAADLATANDRAAAFGFQYTGNFNHDSLTPVDPVLNGPADLQGAVDLESPGWFEYSFGLDAGEAGAVLAEFDNGEAAVVRTFPGGRVMGFGLLNDVFADYEQGVDFFTNAVYAIPEPKAYAAVFAVFAIGAAVAGRRIRRSRLCPNSGRTT